MERIMILDEEDIIRLVARSVDVDTSAVQIKMSVDSRLEEMFVDGSDEVPLSAISTNFKFYARVNLPVTQIDGTPVDDENSIFEDEDNSDDGDDNE